MKELAVFNGDSLRVYEGLRCEMIQLISHNLDIVNRLRLIRELSTLLDYRKSMSYGGYRGHVNFLGQFLEMYGLKISCNYVMGSDEKLEMDLIDNDTNLKLIRNLIESDDNLVGMSRYFNEVTSIDEVCEGYVEKSLITSRLERSKEYYMVFDYGTQVFIHPVLRFYRVCELLNWDLDSCCRYTHLLSGDYVPQDFLDKVSSTIGLEFSVDTYSQSCDGGECLVVYVGKGGELYNPYFVLPLDGYSYSYIECMKCLPVEDSLKSIIEMVFSCKIVNLRPLSDLSRLGVHGYTKCNSPSPKRFKELTNASYKSSMSLERTSNLSGIGQETCMQLFCNLMNYIMFDEFDSTFCFHFFETYIETNLVSFVFSKANKNILRVFVSNFCKNYLQYLCRIALNFLYIEDKDYVMSDQYRKESYTNYMVDGCLLEESNISMICKTLLCMSRLNMRTVTLDVLGDVISILNYVTNNRLIRIRMLKYMIGLQDIHVTNISDDTYKIKIQCYNSAGWDQKFALTGHCMQKRIPVVSSCGYSNLSDVVQAKSDNRFKFYMNMFFTGNFKTQKNHLNSYSVLSPSSIRVKRTYLVEEFMLIDLDNDEDGDLCLRQVRWMPYRCHYDGKYVQTSSGNRFELLRSDRGEVVGRQLPDDVNLQYTSLFT